MAPEVLRNSTFNAQSEMYSFGVLLWELWTYGQVPYAGLNNTQAAEALLTGEKLKIPSTVPTEIKVLLESCWADIPSLRPSFAFLFDSLVELSPKIAVKI